MDGVLFSSLIKYLSYELSFFQLAFEAQPACVFVKRFLIVAFIRASCFLETFYHRTVCYLEVKLKDWTNLFST